MLEIEDIYRRHSYAVFRRCHRLLGDVSEASDMTQEVFLRLLERPTGFAGRSKLSTYLYAMATHLCLNRMRNNRARGELWCAMVARQLESEKRQEAPDAAVSDRQIVSAVLSDTDLDTATVALYHYVDGLSQGEIAELVGLSRVTINQKLKRFRERAANAFTQG